jgi:hypothetical protein
MRAVLALVLLTVSSLQAWNRDGHMTVAWIAYQHLSPVVKAQVDAILQNHPDYPAWTKDLPAGADRSLEAFLHASYWPDELRGDPRFWDDIAREPRPTPPLAGFPDMKMHKNWHYTNVPYVTSGKTAPEAERTNIQERLNAFRAEPISAYNIPWLIHMVGDVHQPLHCVSRFSGHHLNETTGQDRGDLGGNLFQIDDPAKNLHALWDGALGITDSRLDFVKTAASLKTTADSIVRLDTSSWVEESVKLAKTVVYSIGDDKLNSSPPKVTPQYRAALQETARERIALAGYRLAAILNARLQ